MFSERMYFDNSFSLTVSVDLITILTISFILYLSYHFAVFKTSLMKVEYFVCGYKMLKLTLI